MFASDLMNAGQECISSVEFRCDKVATFEYHMLLYWEVPCHFQLCQCKVANAEAHESYFATRCMPEQVKEHYNVCNLRAPIGRQVAGHSDFS